MSSLLKNCLTHSGMLTLVYDGSCPTSSVVRNTQLHHFTLRVPYLHVTMFSTLLCTFLLVIATPCYAQDIVGCGGWGCDQGRSFQLGGIPPLNKNTSVVWAVDAPANAVKAQCVAVTTFAACSFSYVANSSVVELDNKRSDDTRSNVDSEHLDVVSFTAENGDQFFSSNQLPSAMVYPLVSDTVILILGTEAMSGLSIDGSPVGQVIPVNL